MSRTIRVHVKTKAYEERVEEVGLDEYKVWITASPRDGEANEALMEILSDHFGTAPSNLHIISGIKSTHKLIEID
jgi:uncharacterized protein